MSDGFELTLQVGGDVTRDFAKRLAKWASDGRHDILESGVASNLISPPVVELAAMQVAADIFNGRLEIFNYMGDYDEFDNKGAYCADKGVPYNLLCVPRHDHPGSFEFWRPGMDRVTVLDMDAANHICVRALDIQKILCMYIVSSAELRRVLGARVPEVPPLKPFKILGL